MHMRRTTPLKAVSRAASKVRRAEDELAQTLVAAHEAGCAYRKIGEAADMNHESVRKIVLARAAATP